MRIVVLGSFHAGANCVQYAKAFRELGHQVTTVGPPFTEQDAARWRAALLAMAWPPTEQEADRYVTAVLADSPKPDVVTSKGAEVAVDWPYDALLSFWQYGETPQPADPTLLGSSALILGDTHTGHLPSQAAMARAYPHVFVQFRPGDLSAFADHPSAHWLPAAAAPDIWANGASAVRRDIPLLFIGSTTPVHERRCELLRLLQANLGERLQVKHVFGREAAQLIARAELVLNCSLAGDLNMRVPETMMAGGCLLTDDVPGLARFGLRTNGAPGLGYIYQSPAQCLSICRLLLKESSKHTWQTPRYPVRAHAMEHSTYQHRCRELLSCMGLENGVEAQGRMK